MTPFLALEQLQSMADPARAADMAAYHKTPRPYLGIANPMIDTLVADWRAAVDLPARLTLAAGLWDSNIHEARIAAAKLLTQARMRPDADVWALILGWVPEFDAWAIADQVCKAGDRRLTADPARLSDVEPFVTHPNMWARRAALVMTLPWAKQNNPKPADIDVRETVLDWAAHLAADRDWFIQKAIASWLRDLSRHDAPRAQAFLNEHGDILQRFARVEAGQYLPPSSL